MVPRPATCFVNKLLSAKAMSIHLLSCLQRLSAKRAHMPYKICYLTIYRKNMLIPALRTYNPQEQRFCKCSINIW